MSKGYTYGSSYSSSMKPTQFMEIEFEDDHVIELWGSAQSNLKNFAFQKNDIVLNVSYTSIGGRKNLFKEYPDWMQSIVEEHGIIDVDEIHFDWPDMSTPRYSAKFWEELTNQILARGYRRIICCCTAGQGRTGTMLAIINAILSDTSASDSMLEVWSNYDKKAIETVKQEMYVFEVLGEKPPEDWFTRGKSKTPLVVHQSSIKPSQEKSKGALHPPEVEGLYEHLLETMTDAEFALYSDMDDKEQKNFLDKLEDLISGEITTQAWRNHVNSEMIKAANRANLNE